MAVKKSKDLLGIVVRMMYSSVSLSCSGGNDIRRHRSISWEYIKENTSKRKDRRRKVMKR
jgi:hypothetical protein